MTPKTCQRCGREFTPARRGRPPLWCSRDCRRIASEERRAARSGARPVEIREEIRERVVERSRPLSPDGAVDRVLSNELATQKLLRILTARWRRDPPNEPEWNPALRILLLDLWQGYHGAGAADPVPPPPTVDASTGTARAAELQAAVELVLGSPRASREVLRQLAEDARRGELRTGEHTATVAAADDLYTALVVSRTLRMRRT